MTLAVIASLLSTIALWGLLLTFGLWAYRKFHFRSFPWVAAFVVLTPILSFSGKWSTEYLMNQAPQQIMDTALLLGYTGSLGNLVAQLSYWGVFVSNLAYLILAILILSDIVTILSRSGIEVKDRFGQQFISLSQKSTAFGVAMLVLKVVPPASIAVFLNFG